MQGICMGRMYSDGEKILIKMQQMKHRTNSRAFASIKLTAFIASGDQTFTDVCIPSAHSCKR